MNASIITRWMRSYVIAIIALVSSINNSYSIGLTWNPGATYTNVTITTGAQGSYSSTAMWSFSGNGSFTFSAMTNGISAYGDTSASAYTEIDTDNGEANGTYEGTAWCYGKTWSTWYWTNYPGNTRELLATVSINLSGHARVNGQSYVAGAGASAASSSLAEGCGSCYVYPLWSSTNSGWARATGSASTSTAPLFNLQALHAGWVSPNTSTDDYSYWAESDFTISYSQSASITSSTATVQAAAVVYSRAYSCSMCSATLGTWVHTMGVGYANCEGTSSVTFTVNRLDM